MPVPEPFVLATDQLAAVAQSAGLEWVNSDAEKIRAAQEAIANEPPPQHVPRERKSAAVIDEGPLVLVETRKDLSQFKLPFESSCGPGIAASTELRHASVAPRRRDRRCLWQSLESVLVRGVVHQGVPAERHAARQQCEAARFAVGIGMPSPLCLCIGQPVEQCIDGGAAVDVDWLHSSTMSQPARSAASAASTWPPATFAPSMLRSSLNTRPGETEVIAQDALQPARREPRRDARRPSDRSRARASRWRARCRAIRMAAHPRRGWLSASARRSALRDASRHRT